MVIGEAVDGAGVVEENAGASPDPCVQPLNISSKTLATEKKDAVALVRSIMWCTLLLPLPLLRRDVCVTEPK